MQVDFLKAALEENVLDIVGLVVQHIGGKKLKEDAHVALDVLYGIYTSFDPRSVLNAEARDLGQRRRYKSSRPPCIEAR
jgi:hypothetical protein